MFSNLRGLVADVLPKGFQVVRTGGEADADQIYYHVLDPEGRRRTFSHARQTLEDLYGEIRKLSVEARRLDYWKRKAAVTDEDIDALVESVCVNLPKLKGTRWGQAGPGFATPCCGTPVPEGWWWIHEDATMFGQVAPADPAAHHADQTFPSARAFAAHLVDRKESRFGRGVRP